MQGISSFWLGLIFDRLENAAVRSMLRANSLDRQTGKILQPIREAKSKNPGDQGILALHFGLVGRGSSVDPADPVQYRIDHSSYIGASHRQRGSHRTMIGRGKVIGWRWRSFCVNHSRNSSSASTWSS